MAMYRGVVKGNTVVFEEPVDLADGTDVEVHVVDREPIPDGERKREEAFLQYLLQIGRISAIPDRQPDPPGMDRTPIEILSGPLVSETIIEERR